MILPLSDAPNPRGTPVVTWTLIAINVVVYLLVTVPLGRQAAALSDPALAEYVQTVLQTLPPDVPREAVLQGISAYDLVVFKYGFRPAAPQWFNLLTSIFLHGGFMHLFGNMLFLWIYGDNVEHRLGRLRYVAWYLATGVAATLFYALFARESRLPLVGASGAISGVLGFYFLWFPRNTVRMFVFLFPFFMNVVEIPARIVLGIYLVLDNLVPFFLTQDRPGGGVAHGAHIGGFLAGLAVAWYLGNRESRVKPAEFQAEPDAASPPRLTEAVGSLIDQGDLEGAARLYFSLSPEETRRLLTPAQSIALGNWLGSRGHAEAALRVFRRHVRDFPRGTGLAEAHLGIGLIQLELLGQAAAAYQHLLEALESDPAPETAARAREALQSIRDRQKYPMRRFSG